MMSQLSDVSAWIADFDKTLKAVSGQSPAWLKALREQSAARFQELGVPTVKEEDWKYTSLSGLSAQTFVPGLGTAEVSRDFLKSYADDDISLVFVNGCFRPDLSRRPQTLPAGMTIKPLKTACVDHADNVKKAMYAYDPAVQTSFQALNNALWGDGIYIELASKTAAADHLIHLVYLSAGGQKSCAHPRTVIHQGSLSEAKVLESHLSVDDRDVYFVNAMLDVYLEDGAFLHYCNAQKDSEQAFHINNARVWCERGARFNGFTLTTSTGLTRNDLNAVLSGEGSDATLKALYCAYGHQHVDHHTFVEHRVPNCTSNQLYKGILNGAARAVFNGKILVKPEAQQTNSYQLNKTLMLGKDARIDTKPQLEIFADDVKCTHGATIGHLDEDQMFYLQSRCIAKDEATMMLARGFADDVLNQLENPVVQKKLNLLLEPSMAAIGK